MTIVFPFFLPRFPDFPENRRTNPCKSPRFVRIWDTFPAFCCCWAACWRRTQPSEDVHPVEPLPYIVHTGSGSRNCMGQPRACIYGSMDFHAKMPLATLLRLIHFQSRLPSRFLVELGAPRMVASTIVSPCIMRPCLFRRLVTSSKSACPAYDLLTNCGNDETW